MEILFGDLLVQGDFELINIRELGFDRDFMIRPEHRVINLRTGDWSLQFVDISRILIRAGLKTDLAQVHFLKDTDLESAVANFTLNAGQSRLELRKGDHNSDLTVLPKETKA